MNQAKKGRPSRPNLVSEVAQSLRDDIQSERYKIGEKLPSEAQLTGMFSVSRTVIREAVANLRADGMVKARQGSGVYVTAPPPQAISSFQNIDSKRISSMIEVLELRTAIELEAVELAAQRRSPAQDEAIFEAHQDFETAIQNGEDTLDADYAFHIAIAEATNNPRFKEFLILLGKIAIPRQSLQDGISEPTPPTYLAKIAAEHRGIAEAISNRDDEAARAAMRTHLRGSQERYRSLIRTSHS